MASNAVIEPRSLIPMTTIFIPTSTISNTVLNDRTLNLFLYQAVVSYLQPRTSLSLVDFLSGLESLGSVLSSSRSSASAAASKETKTDLPPGVSALTTIGSVAPGVVPTSPTITPTPITPITASSDISITATTSPTSSHDGSITVNISNNLNTPGSGSTNPVVIVGVVLGIVLSLIVLALLAFLLFRRRRRRATLSRHYPSPPNPPIPILPNIPPPMEPHSELPWPTLPDPEFFAPPKRTDGEEAYPHQLPRRPRLSGETLTKEERVGHTS